MIGSSQRQENHDRFPDRGRSCYKPGIFKVVSVSALFPRFLSRDLPPTPYHVLAEGSTLSESDPRSDVFEHATACARQRRRLSGSRATSRADVPRSCASPPGALGGFNTHESIRGCRDGACPAIFAATSELNGTPLYASRSVLGAIGPAPALRHPHPLASPFRQAQSIATVVPQRRIREAVQPMSIEHVPVSLSHLRSGIDRNCTEEAL
jgi:hypothetical protein